MRPIRVYRALLKHFDTQNWWPITREEKPEYLGGPKTPQEKWEVVVGAILTQNTAWANVVKVLVELRTQKLWSIPEITDASLPSLQKAIRAAGYYKQKARYLKGVAQYVQKNYRGDLAKMFSKSTGALRFELLSLKGIGPETADSILLYAAQKPKFVVDAYTLRVGSRLGWPVGRYEKTQEFFEENLPHDVRLYQEYHALLVELGKKVCLKEKPLCKKCPLELVCIKKI